MKKKITLVVFAMILATSIYSQDSESKIQRRVIVDTTKFNHVNKVISDAGWEMFAFRKAFFLEQPTITVHKDQKEYASAVTSKWKIVAYVDGSIVLYDTKMKPHQEIRDEEGSLEQLLAKGLLIDDLIDYEVEHDLYDSSNTKISKLLMTIFLMKKLKQLDLNKQQLSKIQALNVKVAQDIRNTRKNHDINAEIMYRKDIGHTLHRLKKLPKEEQFDVIEKVSLLNKVQMKGMIKIEELRIAYRENVMTLLTEKQKKDLANLNKKSTKS